MKIPQRFCTRATNRRSFIASISVLILATTSCAPSSRNESPPVGKNSDKATSTSEKRPLTISVAASTKDVIGDLVKQFNALHGTEVRINSGSSSSLANQIIAGAPVDIFLSANRSWADEIAKAQLSSQTEPLLTNDLVLIVPIATDSTIHSPDDLRGATNTTIALAGETVPAGIYAEQALTKFGLYDLLRQQKRIIRGQDVRTALNFVDRGEVDAAIVYSTDILSSDRVKVVFTFPSDSHDPIEYNLVKIRQQTNGDLTDSLFTFLMSPQADATYAKFGFKRLARSAQDAKVN